MRRIFFALELAPSDRAALLGVVQTVRGSETAARMRPRFTHEEDYHATLKFVGNVPDELVDVLCSHLPEGPPLYPDGDLTDEPEEILVAELVREAALAGVREELPHSIAVVVDEMVPREDRDLIEIYASLYVERPSQKAIVIGTKGSRLREVGTRARRQIEALLGSRVYLDLRVRVAKDWQSDPKQWRRLGFDQQV